MLYGYIPNLNAASDPLVHLVDRMMIAFSETTAAGVWMVDKIPWLRHLPEWLPGMEFKSLARGYHKMIMDVTNVPYQFAALQRSKGENRPSYVSGLMDRHDKKVLDEEASTMELKLIKDSAISMYGGGSDTTVAGLSFFFRAMILNPEVQKKAQEEIDRVIGKDRLPTFEDRESLPYIEAVFKEALRFNPIVPAGFPHTCDVNDEFGGYRIPKGSIVVPSIQWFSRDPKTYAQPDLFRPERFLTPEQKTAIGFNPGKLGLRAGAELSPKKWVFGFGRRICPGQQLADASTWLTIALTLAVFDIKKPIDPATGLEIEPEISSTPGTVSHPTPFQCSFVPRSEKAKQLIMSIETEQPYEDKGDAKIVNELMNH
ncbi:hypothetical protein AA313_de0203516 [Arthrobotrys entomopaga]|nr:hypothetical protein AA313_de0203516 [Arthrobotrys entomopaga]